MDALRTSAFVLFVLVEPVSSSEIFFTDPVICYFLDAFLLVYCIVATALFFREKFSRVTSDGVPEDNNIYQELNRPKDTDPYQMLELKGRKKGGKKKKSGSTSAQEMDKDPYESLMPNGSAPPPVSPQ